MTKDKKKVALVFGTFDNFHPGHEFFLKRAKQQAERLVVGIARDEHIQKFKNKQPEESDQVRRDVIRRLGYVNEAILCDREINSYTIIDYVKPDLIIIGHDQIELEKSLQTWMDKNGKSIDIVKIDKYEPET